MDLSCWPPSAQHDAGAVRRRPATPARAAWRWVALGEETGAQQYRAATTLFGDAHHSMGNLDEAHRAYDELLALETDPVRRSAVYRKKAVAKTVEGELDEAYGYFVTLVRELGFDFNTLPTADEGGHGAVGAETLGEFGLAELLEQLPRNDELVGGVASTHKKLVLRHDRLRVRPESFQAVQSYTIIHCFDRGAPPSALPMITAWAYCAASIRDYSPLAPKWRAGCRLAERHSPPAIAERARTLYAILAMHYERSCDEQLLELRACADRCAAHGDLEYAGTARSEHDAILMLTHGATPQVSERIASTRAWATELHVLPSLRAATRMEAHPPRCVAEIPSWARAFRSSPPACTAAPTTRRSPKRATWRSARC